MASLESRVKHYFAEYERRANAALKSPPIEDVDGIVGSFAPYFVESSPKGVVGGANDERFRDMIPKGYANYRAVGGTGMTIEQVAVTDLDPLHAMARIDWNFSYARDDGRSGNVRFQNIYFLTAATGELKCFAYITPDEEAAMKEHGLLSQDRY